jgi:ABC-2 type transport system permease protein
MTAIATRPTADSPAVARGVTQARVARSEWTKFRSLRSTRWTLLAAVVLTIGIGALFAAVTSSHYDSMSLADRLTFEPISLSLSGVLFAQLAIGVLGVLVFSGEYGTGMIRASLTVVPQRLPVLWAKLGVFAGFVFVVSVVTSLVSFLLGQALLSPHHLGVSLAADTALRSVVGSALYMTVVGLIGISLGAILRNTAAGISTLVGAFFVVPPLLTLLPSSWTSHFVQYLPSNAGEALWAHSDDAHALSPWTGFGVLCIYAVVLIGAAAWRLVRSDA